MIVNTGAKYGNEMRCLMKACILENIKSQASLAHYRAVTSRTYPRKDLEVRFNMELNQKVKKEHSG